MAIGPRACCICSATATTARSPMMTFPGELDLICSGASEDIRFQRMHTSCQRRNSVRPEDSSEKFQNSFRSCGSKGEVNDFARAHSCACLRAFAGQTVQT